MQQRGRKSVSGLVAQDNLAPIPRMAPPGDLSDYEAAIWTSVINTKPADWFQADTLPLLLSYCKHVSTAATLDKELSLFDPGWLRDDDGLKRFKLLTDMRERESRALTALARSMRLTQQAQIHKETAGVKSRKVTGSRPWDAK